MNYIQYLFIIIFLSFSVTTFSQDKAIQYGFKAGVNFSSIASEQFNVAGIPRVGILIGALVEIPISKEFYFGPEIIYSHQGNVKRFDELGTNFINRTHINYINVPLLFKYDLNDNLAIDLGPYAGFNIISKTVNREGGNRISSDIDGVNTIDTGLAGSITYSLSTNYFTTARYSRGFTSVFDNTADAFGLRSRNSVLNISFGLYL